MTLGKRRRDRKPKKKVQITPVVVDEEEKDSEDYCFVCKDGGELIICDFKGCVKAYHTDCVGKGESAENIEENWICGWHSCFNCEKDVKYQCLCCPNAVCQPCLKLVKFAIVRGNKGFCNECLNLAILGDEGAEFDSDGERVDFKDRETYEGLFKEYWDIINEKEQLTLEDLHNADEQLKKGRNVKPQRRKVENFKTQPHESSSDSEAFGKEDDDKEASSDDLDGDEPVQPILVRSKKKPKKSMQKCKESKKIEYVGWASKSLMEFLMSIGVDTSKKLSQDDVVLLINKYVQENKLFHPEKRKVILCDVRLRTVLGRRSVSIYKINDVLEAHLAENIEQSEDEGYSSGCEDNALLSTKKDAWWRKVGSFQNKGSLMEKFRQKDDILQEPAKKDVVKVVHSQFATIVPKNLKLVYLRKGLLEQLLVEQCETFETKVIGSFVKVKSDPFDPRHPYCLVPVTGIKKLSGEENKRKVFLQVSCLPSDVPISLLSNDDLSEEDCEELRRRIETGLLAKPTVVELEEKAKGLHEDITKHWITRELSILRHRIDLANEKGRRAELYEYRRKRDLLQSEDEQVRLLKEIPKVIADVIEIKSGSEEPSPDDTHGNVPALNNHGGKA